MHELSRLAERLAGGLLDEANHAAAMTELDAVEWYVKERIISDPVGRDPQGPVWKSCNSLLEAATTFHREARSLGTVPLEEISYVCHWTRETLGRMAPVIDRVDKLVCSQPGWDPDVPF